MNIDTNLLGDNLIKVRQEKQLEISEVAKALGYSTYHWKMVEQGKRLPTIDALILFCQKFDCSLDLLFTQQALSHAEQLYDTDFSKEITPGDFFTLLKIVESVPKSEQISTGIVNPKRMGERLKKARLKKQMTLKEMATQTGLVWHYIQRIEKGQSIPPLKTIMKLTQVLGVSPDYLFVNDIPKSKPILYNEFIEELAKFSEPQKQVAQNIIAAYLQSLPSLKEDNN